MTYEIYEAEKNYDSSGNKWEDGMENMAEDIRVRDQKIGAKVLEVLGE